MAAIEECPICLEPLEDLSEDPNFTLPCDHCFHTECVNGLRKSGVSQACPLCRAAIPPGPEQLYDEATRKYMKMRRRMTRRGGSWSQLRGSELKELLWVSKTWKAAADQGNTHAQYNLACMCRDGHGVEGGVNLGEAARLYRLAASKGHTDAQHNLASLLVGSSRTTAAQNEAEAVRLWRSAAEQGHAHAQKSLGVMYANGRGDLKASDKNAVEWYRKAADQGLKGAQCSLGLMYSEGRGVKQSYARAARWYRKAAAQNDPEALYSLAVMYDEGRGVEKNSGEALRLYKLAAEQNYPDALFNLAVMAETGEGIAKNNMEAVRLYRQAADLGDANARHSLGVMYRDGLVSGSHESAGVAASRKGGDMEASRLFRLAADQGLPEAQSCLAGMYEAGRGVGRSDADAVRLYQAAAASGDTDAMKALALKFLRGSGVRRNETEAARLYQCAAAAGDVAAMCAAGKIYQDSKGSLNDDVKAVTLLRTATTAGIAEAQGYLGKMYLEGRGGLEQDAVKAFELMNGAAGRNDPASCFLLAASFEKGGSHKDETKAVHWCLRAAELGHAPAQYAVARRLEHGKGIPKNITKAYEFYSMAASCGFEKAARAKQKLDEKAPQGIAGPTEPPSEPSKRASRVIGPSVSRLSRGKTGERDYNGRSGNDGENGNAVGDGDGDGDCANATGDGGATRGSRLDFSGRNANGSLMRWMGFFNLKTMGHPGGKLGERYSGMQAASGKAKTTGAPGGAPASNEAAIESSAIPNTSSRASRIPPPAPRRADKKKRAGRARERGSARSHR